MSDGNFRSAIIAVSSLHVNLQDLNNYLNEMEPQMGILLNEARRFLNIGQTEEEAKMRMEAELSSIESMKMVIELMGSPREYIPVPYGKTEKEVREGRENGEN